MNIPFVCVSFWIMYRMDSLLCFSWHLEKRCFILSGLYFRCKCCKTVDLKKKNCLQFAVTAIWGDDIVSSHFVKALPYSLLIHVAVAFSMNKT